MHLMQIFFIVLSAVICSGACSPSPGIAMPGASESYNDPDTPRFAAVSVHDPSVFPSGDGEFYVMGSHLAVAKTADFIRWQQVTGDWNSRRNRFYPEDNPNPSVQTMQSQIDDVMRGAKNALGFFAGDIRLMPNGKFFFYYCITSSWYCSAIGLAIADKIEGAYITQGLIVRSGEAAGSSLTPDKTSRWSQSSHPNCIDPQVFFDKDSKNFYMVYGSWSGGIFLLELDPNTGMLLEGSVINTENGGYGKKLILSNHVSIEGPYIIYSPQTDYYYLFVSYGDLFANGGYNMRMFRSRNAEGPYEDAAHPGQDMAKLLKVSEHYKYGVKIMGGYQFENLEGEQQRTTAYLSPGHNSVYYDQNTGDYFLVYHQRFAGLGEHHEVHVRRMFLNEDGWFVASPFRYDGGAMQTFNESSLTGTWKIINHGNVNNTVPVKSERFDFLKGGKIRSEHGDGTWRLGNDGRTAYIIINDILYKGLFIRCYDEDNRRWVQSFSALSQDGTALWGAGVSL